MHIVISYPPGFSVEGIVLWSDYSTMRVAVRNWDDAAVFRSRDGEWEAENGDVVQIQTWRPALLVSEAAPAIPVSAP